jgi:hypothetical protein
MPRESEKANGKPKAEHHRLPELREKLARLDKLSIDEQTAHANQGFDVTAAKARTKRLIAELEGLK